MAGSSRSLVVVLATALALALVVIGYLLGQQDSPSAPTPVEVAEAPSAPLPPPGPPPPGSRTAAPPPAAPTGEAIAPEVEPTPPPSAEPEAPSEATACVAVKQYFVDLDLATAAVESSSKTARGDSMVALQESLRGDSANLDSKLAQYQAARDAVRGMSVPSPAQRHHALTLRALDEGIALLRTLKEVTAAPDMSRVAELPAKGKRIMRLSQETDALAGRIRQQSCSEAG